MGVIKQYQSSIYGNYKKKWFRYGFLMGLALIAVIVLRYAMIYPISLPVSILQNIILVALMFGFTYLYRKDNPDKKLTFKESYLLNIGVGVIAGIIYSAFLWFYATYIDNDFCARYIDSQIIEYEKLTISDVEIVQRIDELKGFSTPTNLAFRAFMEISIISILFALIVSIFMRTEKAPIREKRKK